MKPALREPIPRDYHEPRFDGPGRSPSRTAFWVCSAAGACLDAGLARGFTAPRRHAANISITAIAAASALASRDEDLSLGQSAGSTGS